MGQEDTAFMPGSSYGAFGKACLKDV